VPLTALLPQALFDFAQQAFGFEEIAADHRNVDDGAKFEQVLLHQMLATLAAGQQAENYA
jgi:hypothetical protein